MARIYILKNRIVYTKARIYTKTGLCAYYGWNVYIQKQDCVYTKAGIYIHTYIHIYRHTKTGLCTY